MKRFRELSYALRFCAIRAFVLSVAVSASVAAAFARSMESVSARISSRAWSGRAWALEPVTLPTVSFTPAYSLSTCRKAAASSGSGLKPSCVDERSRASKVLIGC